MRNFVLSSENIDEVINLMNAYFVKNKNATYVKRTTIYLEDKKRRNETYTEYYSSIVKKLSSAGSNSLENHSIAILKNKDTELDNQFYTGSIVTIIGNTISFEYIAGRMAIIYSFSTDSANITNNNILTEKNINDKVDMLQSFVDKDLVIVKTMQSLTSMTAKESKVAYTNLTSIAKVKDVISNADCIHLLNKNDEVIYILFIGSEITHDKDHFTVIKETRNMIYNFTFIKKEGN